MQAQGRFLMVFVAMAAVGATACGDTGSAACDVVVSAHPETQFPLGGGPHGCVTCDSCHVPRLGTDDRTNVSCIDCHDHARATSDAQHDGVAHYQWSDAQPAFCRICHPRGGL